jgi:Na+/proline symporter
MIDYLLGILTIVLVLLFLMLFGLLQVTWEDFE